MAFIIRRFHSCANRHVVSCSVPKVYKKQNVLPSNRVNSEDIKHDSTPFGKNFTSPFNKNFIVNNCSRTYDKPECFNPFTNPYVRAKISRCQLKINNESCCRACNSDVIFEIMKSLYDCYKNKNCENCNCILCGCGHLPREEIQVKGEEIQGEVEKSTVAKTSEYKRKENKLKVKVRHAMDWWRLRRPEQTVLKKEKIIRGLAKQGTPLLPEGKTASERKMIAQAGKDIGLPAEAKTASQRQKMAKALKADIIKPLEGKTKSQKGKLLKARVNARIPLPKGRTASEKALIEKVKAVVANTHMSKEGRPKHKKNDVAKVPSKKLISAKITGLLTPLKKKSAVQKEKIVKRLVKHKHDLLVPEEKTLSEKMIKDKIRRDVGLPPSAQTPSARLKYNKAMAAGLITPLQGKSSSQKEKILRGLAYTGMPLPEGRTPSEKALVADIRATTQERVPIIEATPLEEIRKAKAEGLLIPLEGKTDEQKEKILKGLTKHRIPLPKGRTESEKKVIEKVRQDMGLKTPHDAKLYEKSAKNIKDGSRSNECECDLLTPEYERFNLVELQFEKLKDKIESGLLTPLTEKSASQKENTLKGLVLNGLPLPEAKTYSEKKLIDKVRKDLGLPPEPKTASKKAKLDKAYAAGVVTPLEGKTASQKFQALQRMVRADIQLPEGRTRSEKDLIDQVRAKTKAPPVFKLASEKMRKAMAAGFLTPLEGKTPKQKEKILKGLATNGIPLPEGKTPSEKILIDKVRRDVGLPPKPQTSTARLRYGKAMVAGLITPLQGKSFSQKKYILGSLADIGISLPEGRTPSEKALIEDIKATTPAYALKAIPLEKIHEAEAEGLLTPLEGKTDKQKVKILKGLAKHGIPLPKGKTPSEKKLIDHVRKKIGLPPEPKTALERTNMTKAQAAGIITPLEGKSASQKFKILHKMADAGIELPEGRTSSEKSMILKVKAKTKKAPHTLLEKLRAAKAAGLAKHEIPLPKAKTASEKKVKDKVRKEIRLLAETEIASKNRMTKELETDIIKPLEVKKKIKKEKKMKTMADAGFPIPEGKTELEKRTKVKVRQDMGFPPQHVTNKGQKPLLPAQATKLVEESTKNIKETETLSKKEKFIRELAKHSKQLPVEKIASERKIIDQARKDMGLLAEAKTTPQKRKMAKVLEAGVIKPVDRKTKSQKENILKAMADAGVPLPEGRTESEKRTIDKVRHDMGFPRSHVAKEGRTPAQAAKLDEESAKNIKEGSRLDASIGVSKSQIQTVSKKEKNIRELAKHGIQFQEEKTASEKKLIDKVRGDIGLTIAKTASQKKMMAKALEACTCIGTLLERKTKSQKEKLLKAMADAEVPIPDRKRVSRKSRKENVHVMAFAGVPLPEGRTASEKSLIAKVKAASSEKFRKAKAEGLLTPLEGKTLDQKEKILRGLAKHGLLPEGRTKSERKLIEKVRKEMGLPPKPKTASQTSKMAAAQVAGIISPLEGKSVSQKEKILKALADAGVTLPEGRTQSEKALIAKVKAAAEIKKTTTCEVACGCENKKIKYKESYVNIRVTSPDATSLCDCPSECIPRVESRVFADEEGIKVIIGRATGECLYTPKSSKYSIQPILKSKISHISLPSIALHSSHINKNTEISKPKILRNQNNQCPIIQCIDRDKYVKNDYIDNYSFKANDYSSQPSINFYNASKSNCSTNVCGECCEGVKLWTKSYESICETESSLSLSTSPFSERGTVSVISFAGSTISSNESQYSQNTFGGNIDNNPCYKIRLITAQTRLCKPLQILL